MASTKEKVKREMPINLRRDALWINDFLKHVDHVIVLTVDITDNDYWLLDSQ